MSSGKASGYGEFRKGWPAVVSSLLAIGFGLSPMPIYTIGLFAPELARAFHWSFADIQFGFPIMSLCVLFASPTIGLLADRYGARPVSLISLSLFGLIFMSFSLSSGSLAQFYITFGLLASLGAGTLPMTWTRVVNNHFEVRKGLALGLALLGSGLFAIFIKPTGSWMIAHLGWRGAYAAIGALPLLIALPVAFFLFHDVDRSGDLASRRAADAARRAAAGGRTLPQALQSWRFWVLGLAIVPITFVVAALVSNMENILHTHGFTKAQAVPLTAAIGVAVIGGRLVGGWLMDRFWAPAVGCVLLIMPALACWLLAHGPLPTHLALLATVLTGVAGGIEYDLMAYLAARYFGLRSYSAIYGAIYGFFAIGGGVGPPVFGQVYDRTHSYQAILTVSAFALVASALLLLTLGRYPRYAEDAVPASA